MAPNTMRAVNYVGPHKVRVQEVEMPKLEHPDDIIVKVTTVGYQHCRAPGKLTNSCYRLLFAAPTCSKYTVGVGSDERLRIELMMPQHV